MEDSEYVILHVKDDGKPIENKKPDLKEREIKPVVKTEASVPKVTLIHESFIFVRGYSPIQKNLGCTKSRVNTCSI